MLRQIRYALIVAVLALLASLIFIRLPLSPSEGDAEFPESQSDSSRIQIASSTIEVEVADTSEEREKGLGGREGLFPNHGMLFIFDEDGRHGFWMKDMRFALDIIWISHDGVVVHIEEDVGPETYPAAFLPRGEARYVVELPAGWVAEHMLRVGDIVRLLGPVAG